jgi:exopolyphosphatase/pppGpp-phosphohydrolase
MVGQSHDAQSDVTEQPASDSASEAQQKVDSDLQAVLKLAQSCEYDAQHSHQVARLALRLFDELRAVHGLGPQQRLWLQYAALLHDTGMIEGKKGHHKASLRIILDSPILPFGKTERRIIGSVARYHRGALPRERHRHFSRLKPATRRVVRILAAILRLANALDHSHQDVVQDIVCDLSPKRILVRCTAQQTTSPESQPPAEAERLNALRRGDLLEQVFERQLAVECYPM